MSPTKNHLSSDARAAVIAGVEAGRTTRDVAKQFNVSQSTVSRIVAHRVTHRKEGSGTPQKTTVLQDRTIVRLSKMDPKLSAPKIKSTVEFTLGVSVSVDTIRRRLNDAKLFARRPSRKPFINKVNRKKRLAFAKRHISRTPADWSKVLWSDESKFNLFSSDGIQYVRCPPGCRDKRQYQVPTEKHGGGSVMV